MDRGAILARALPETDGSPVFVELCRTNTKTTVKPSPLSGDSSHAITDVYGHRFPSLIQFAISRKHFASVGWYEKIGQERGAFKAMVSMIDEYRDGHTHWSVPFEEALLSGMCLLVQQHSDVEEFLLSTLFRPIICISTCPILTDNMFGRLWMIVRQRITTTSSLLAALVPSISPIWEMRALGTGSTCVICGVAMINGHCSVCQRPYIPRGSPVVPVLPKWK